MYPNTTQMLVVDDMMAMRIRVSNQLKSMGFVNIQQAGNGEEAFAILEKSSAAGQPIEFIISDWNMPVMTGIDFLIKLRSSENFKSLPFLMVTAEGEKQQVVKALKSGVTDYLIKPIDSILLQQKIVSIWTKLKSA